MNKSITCKNTGNKVREDLKCLSVGGVWEKLKYLSQREGLSVSAWIRNMAINEYRKEAKAESQITKTGVQK